MNSFSQYKESYQKGKTLPQDFYTDESIFTDEMKTIYFKQWLMVDHVTRIKNPGDYFVFEAEKESIIIIRGRDNEVRAFYNVCTHRGNILVEKHQAILKILLVVHHHQFLFLVP